MSGEMHSTDGNTAVFHFQFRKCVSVCGNVGGGGSGFHAPGMELTSRSQYEGLGLFYHGSTKRAMHDYHHLKSHDHYSSTCKEPGPFSAKDFTTHLV